MRRALARFALAATLAGAATAEAALAPDELFRQLSSSVWRIVTRDASNRPLASGSAVVVEAGTLVTNCHVLKGATTVSAVQGTSSYPARLAHADVERDLCQLLVPGISAPPVKLASQEAHVGQRVYTIGAPRQLEATLSDGLVSALRRDAQGRLVYIQISAPISPGSSGGGLFDDEGHLLGITSAGMGGEAQNLNFARPASQIPEIPARATAALDHWRETQASARLPEQGDTAAKPIEMAAGPAPLPDPVVRASGLSSKPASALRLDMAMVLNRTWIYPHPLDEASYGNIELTFTKAGLSANSKRGRATGSFDVRDDELCIYLKSSSTTCYFLIESNGSTQLYFPRSGIRSRVAIRN